MKMIRSLLKILRTANKANAVTLKFTTQTYSQCAIPLIDISMFQGQKQTMLIKCFSLPIL